MIEDNPWVGVVLHELILEATPANVSVFRSVADAEKALAESQFDFAFLDVNVTDGKTYGIAADLMDHEIPFAFMSGFLAQNEVPENLRHVPFLMKPYRPAQIRSLLSNLPGTGRQD